MPKRSTQTYSSEDAPESDDAKIVVYYCKYSGDPVLITDAVLGQLPKRKTDGARVLDTTKHVVRLKATPEVKAVLVKRDGGKLEKQYRYRCGELPVCYKSEPEGKYLYVMDGAVSAFNFGAGGGAGEAGETPVPPCIQPKTPGTVQIALEIEDRKKWRAITKITADEVGVAVNAKCAVANDEIVEFLGKTLHLRLPQMSLLAGWSARSKLLVVQGLTPQQVYDRLQSKMDENKARIDRLVKLHGADNKFINKPEVEKLDSIDPELLKKEIKNTRQEDPYDAFRVKGGANQYHDPYAPEEHGPTNVYMAKDKNAGMNWNDAGPHRISSTSTL